MNLMMSFPSLLAYQTADNQANAPAESSGGMPVWATLLIVAGMLFLPFIIGQVLANVLRLRDLGTKIGIALFVITMGAAPFVSQLASGGQLKDALDWGIDLAGGTNMVFVVDHEKAAALEKTVDSESMDKLVGAVARRVNPGGNKEVVVRRVGQDRIEVIVPGADPDKVAQIKKEITQLGSLEFGLLANNIEHPALIASAQALPDDVNELTQDGAVVAMWRRVGINPKTEQPKPVGREYGVVTRTVTGDDGEPYEQFLVVVDPNPQRRITGQLLKRAYPEVGSSGAPVVGFEFNTRGGYLFQRLTARHLPREASGHFSRLAILLNGEIHSAPRINDMIGAVGVIEGDFDPQELEELTNVLNAGALEIPLEEDPINEFTISPTLGIEVQQHGLNAIMWALGAVVVVTLGYYLVAGFVADVCLAVNMLLLMGSMALIDGTFTLPGLAGVALAVGMAVDANVLIFERIREEQEKGSSLRMSIQNGFGKALSAIVDSNVTTLITAVVLYVLGSEQVKGFAVTLFIGLVWNMFCAIFLARLIFDICERKKWLTSLKMMSLVKGGGIDFIGKRRIAFAASVIVIVSGLAALASRGVDNLDIDFRGGAMVTFRFEEPQPTVDDVRGALEEEFGPAITLERLEVEETPGAAPSILFTLRTVDDEEEEVGKRIANAFAKTPYDQFELVQQHLTIGAIEPIAEAQPDETEEGTEEAAAAPTDPYAGGSRVQLTTSLPVAVSTLLGEVETELKAVGSFDDPGSLLALTPLDESADVKTTEFLLKTRSAIDPTMLETALTSIATKMESEPAFEQKTTFDASVASDTKTDALVAIVLSNLAIVFYLWFRFQKVTFGLAAVVAVVHDITIVLGMVALGAYLSGTGIGQLLALQDFKIDLSIVAAFLTIIGYSLNDTIVVFDRIREVRGRNPNLTGEMVNTSLNQTLARTVLTSSTTLLVLLILYILGGEGVHGFSYCMLLGIMVGTYSSIFVASPVLVWLSEREAAGGGRQLKTA
mgnify:FL=1